MLLKNLTRRSFLFAMISGTGGALYYYARHLETQRLTVNVEELSLSGTPLAQPLRVLHLSDLHASQIVPFSLIESAIETGLSYEPDLACITGDFITDTIDATARRRFQEILSRLSAAVPTMASFGNHDGGAWARRRGGYRSLHEVRDLLTACNVIPLLNQTHRLIIGAQPLRVSGIGDLWAEMLKPEEVLTPVDQPPQEPVIVLSHNPDTKDYLNNYYWNLMLSGHTHGGQIRIPLIGAPFAPVRDKRFVEGLHRWEGRWIHITRGVGNVHGVRINCRPQVSILNLI